jgi:hypothetical protein
MCRIGGSRRSSLVRGCGDTGEIPPLGDWLSNPEPVNPGRGQCQRVSLTGAVSSQSVTEEFEGTLSMVGNHAKSVRV